MVVPPHRDGGQAQYLEAAGRAYLRRRQRAAAICSNGCRPTWTEPLTVPPAGGPGERVRADAGAALRPGHRHHPAALADRSARPARPQLLEETDETVDYIADRCGFGNAMALRHHFRIWRQTTPHAYRTMFRGDPALTQNENTLQFCCG